MKLQKIFTILLVGACTQAWGTEEREGGGGNFDDADFRDVGYNLTHFYQQRHVTRIGPSGSQVLVSDFHNAIATVRVSIVSGAACDRIEWGEDDKHAIYDHATNTITVCDIFATKTEFRQVRMFAHEILRKLFFDRKTTFRDDGYEVSTPIAREYLATRDNPRPTVQNGYYHMVGADSITPNNAHYIVGVGRHLSVRSRTSAYGSYYFQTYSYEWDDALNAYVLPLSNYSRQLAEVSGTAVHFQKQRGGHNHWHNDPHPLGETWDAEFYSATEPALPRDFPGEGVSAEADLPVAENCTLASAAALENARRLCSQDGYNRCLPTGRPQEHRSAGASCTVNITVRGTWRAPAE